MAEEKFSVTPLTISTLGLIASSIAVCLAAITAYLQGRLAKTIHSEQASRSTQIHNEQMTLSQRQIFVDIWPRLADLSKINPASPVEPDVVKTINVLELVAVCCEGNMLDISVIRRTFRHRYLEFYETIGRVGEMSTGKSGQDLLRENPAIGKLYEKLKKEVHDADEMRPI